MVWVNADAWEDFRPDRDAYPPSVLGRGNGRPGERRVDIRRLDVLRPILAARMDMCAEKGFDAVDPDLLKNDLDQIPAPVDDFDFAVNEKCAEFDECAKLVPFVASGKAGLHAECSFSADEPCGTAEELVLDAIRKRLDLDVWRRTC
ncbi:endo alpha-1,4 polygalactosaminidase [Streptomyces megasporus]|uniref:endo alpha-1,4 polygalactosaminidase n=1 Tax=Streptomyces megasporus TaxID=44060 RepID=UPI00068CDFB6|nr:endo alpha-1,4 polygalactosaminidase [Streptomyces megasporus]